MRPAWLEQVHWQHTVSGAAVRIDGTVHRLPQRLARQVLEACPDGLSADPATDLLEVDRRQRVRALDAIVERDDAEVAVTVARAELVTATGRAARAVRARLRRAITRHTAATRALEHAGHDYRMTREFIASLPVRTGRLAAAQRGWARSPATPDFVTTVESERAFLASDSRRAVTAAWGADMLGGVTVGECWRRDWDEDPRERVIDRSGPWTMGYLPHTGEVYALRRCPHLPEMVWLIGTGFDDSVLDCLRRQQLDMLTPNSLLAAAHTVHEHPRAAISATNRLRNVSVAGQAEP